MHAEFDKQVEPETAEVTMAVEVPVLVILAPHIENDVAPAKTVLLPVGQGVFVDEPSGQYEPGGHKNIVGRPESVGMGQ